MLTKEYSTTRASRAPGIALATIVALAASALLVKQKTTEAEVEHPAQGNFLEVDGTRLHYLERGTGEAVVLLHGNGSMLDDFASSGVVAELAKHHRVIVFDRPGYGYSQRTEDRVWDQKNQAELFYQAILALNIEAPILVGHSWGAMVAAALALSHPEAIKRLVLISGYYYPTPRLDAPIMSLPAVPVVGTLLRHTISPLISRLMWPMNRKQLFAPAQVSESFKNWPVWMTLRPSQLQASAAETALMIPGAALMQDRYAQLKMPVTIVAGDGDRIVDTPAQSGRLHEAVAQSELITIPDAGHMLQHIDPQAVIQAIVGTASASTQRNAPPPRSQSAL